MSQTMGKKMSHMFLERLLDRVDPHQLPEDSYLRSAQQLCGQWIALQRLAKNNDLEHVASRARVAASKIGLLETGLAHARDLTAAEIQALSVVIAPHSDSSEREWAANVIRLSMGQRVADMDTVMERVVADIERYSQRAVIEQEPVPTVHPLALTILRMLRAKPRHSYDLVDELLITSRHDPGINDASIAAYIQQMYQHKLITIVKEAVDPDVDDQRRPYYAMTALGQKVLARSPADIKLGRLIGGLPPVVVPKPNS